MCECLGGPLLRLRGERGRGGLGDARVKRRGAAGYQKVVSTALIARAGPAITFAGSRACERRVCVERRSHGELRYCRSWLSRVFVIYRRLNGVFPRDSLDRRGKLSGPSDNEDEQLTTGGDLAEEMNDWLRDAGDGALGGGRKRRKGEVPTVGSWTPEPRKEGERVGESKQASGTCVKMLPGQGCGDERVGSCKGGK